MPLERLDELRELLCLFIRDPQADPVEKDLALALLSAIANREPRGEEDCPWSPD